VRRTHNERNGKGSGGQEDFQGRSNIMGGRVQVEVDGLTMETTESVEEEPEPGTILPAVEGI
jgi:hypothetical protein